MSEEELKGFSGFGILDQNGHRRVAGYVTEEQRFGSVLGRMDVLGPDGTVVGTYYFGASSVYGFSPCTEEAARIAAAGTEPDPVHSYDVRLLVDRLVESGVECRIMEQRRRENDILRAAARDPGTPAPLSGRPDERLVIRDGRVVVTDPKDPDYPWTVGERIQKLRRQSYASSYDDRDDDIVDDPNL